MAVEAPFFSRSWRLAIAFSATLIRASAVDVPPACVLDRPRRTAGLWIGRPPRPPPW